MEGDLTPQHFVVLSLIPEISLSRVPKATVPSFEARSELLILLLDDLIDARI